MKALLHRLFVRPPVFFPLLALAHWLLVVQHLVPFERDADALYMVVGLWKLTGALLCTALTLLKRWSGIAYILLTCIGLSLYGLYYFHWGSSLELARLGTSLFPLDIIVCFLVLFFYKRLEGWPASVR